MPKHGRALTAWTRSVSGSISLPSPGCFSPFPHGTVRYRSRPVGCLGPWAARLPTRLLVSRGTRDDCAPDALVVRDSHPLRCAFPDASHPDCPQRWVECTPPGRSHNPRHATRTRLTRAWFGRQPISLATTLGRLLLPQATEMFQFAWFPPPDKAGGHTPTACGVAPFGDGRLNAWLPLPYPYAADRRPSSAGRAEASSDRAFCLAWSLVSSAVALGALRARCDPVLDP